MLELYTSPDLAVFMSGQHWCEMWSELWSQTSLVSVLVPPKRTLTHINAIWRQHDMYSCVVEMLIWNAVSVVCWNVPCWHEILLTELWSNKLVQTGWGWIKRWCSDYCEDAITLCLPFSWWRCAEQPLPVECGLLFLGSQLNQTAFGCDVTSSYYSSYAVIWQWM